MGICKSRAKVPSCEERVKPPPMTAKAVNTSSKQQAKEVPQTFEPLKLPTQSWRALLQEQPLNADAPAFIPSQVKEPLIVEAYASQAKPKSRTTTAKPKVYEPEPKSSSLVEDENEPQWMAYLSKKLEAKSSQEAGQQQHGMVTKIKTAAQPIGGRDQMPNPNMDSLPGAGGTGVIIRTEAYLKLLKEGGAKKKVQKPSGVDVPKQMIPIEQQPKFDVPITATNLVQRWACTITKKANANGIGTAAAPAEDAKVEELTTRDDISIPTMHIDSDLSDPGYYSETDLADAKTSASLHRLGYRPKVATSAIRTYVMQDLSYELDQAVGMLLCRLQRFTEQQKANEMKSAGFISSDLSKQLNNRRFVIGLKEVARRVKQAKIACLIVAPDIEEDANSGGLDDRMREMLASAYQNNIPVIFALSRTRLGKALSKALQISVLGVIDARGAKDFLKQAVDLASLGRQEWLARRFAK